MVYGVTIQTLDRAAGNGLTMVFVDTSDAPTAATLAAKDWTGDCAATARVVADHPVELCRGSTPTVAVRTRRCRSPAELARLIRPGRGPRSVPVRHARSAHVEYAGI